MATSGPDQLAELVRSYKDNHWLEHSGKPEGEIQQLWHERMAELTSIIGASPPVQPESSLGKGVEAPMMARRQTEQPASHPLQRTSSLSISGSGSRKRANSSGTSASPAAANVRDVPALTANWQRSSEEYPSNGYLPSPAKMQRTESGRQRLQRVPEIAAEATEYDPEEYIRRNGLAGDRVRSNSTQSRPLHIQARMPTSPSVPSPLGTSFASSLPLTPPSTFYKNPSAVSHGMSRQSSLAGSFIGGLGMMKLHSQISEGSDLSAGPDLSSLDFQPPWDMQKDHSDAFPELEFDTSPLVGYTQGVAQDSSLSEFVPHPVTAQNSHPSALVEAPPIQRTSSGDSNASSHSTGSQSRTIGRPLAPKGSPYGVINAGSSDGQLGCSIFENGKIAIAKAACRRPRKEKLRCDQCDEHPEGFRGDHELARHTARAHSTDRKVWVCIDASPDKDKLSSCKACRSNKPYNAYYNAAAHLRRVHFNPVKKSRKVVGVCERAGKGGGDKPAMEELKKFWMEERDEVKDQALEVTEIEDDDLCMGEEAIDATAASDAAPAQAYQLVPESSRNIVDATAAAVAHADPFSSDIPQFHPRHLPQEDFAFNDYDFGLFEFDDGYSTYAQPDPMLPGSLANSGILAA